MCLECVEALSVFFAVFVFISTSPIGIYGIPSGIFGTIPSYSASDFGSQLVVLVVLEMGL